MVRGENHIIFSRHCGKWENLVLIQLYTFGVSMRTFTKQTQCHLADGVKDGGEDLVRVKLLDISFYKLECVML